MKKDRLFVAVVCAGMFLFFLAGLFFDRQGKTDIQKDDTKTLHIWGGVPESAGPYQVIEAFNEKFEKEGIQAEYHYFANNSNGNRKLENALQTGREIDAYFSYDVAVLYDRANNDMALDLTTYLKRDHIQLSEYYNINVYDYYIGGRPYGIPTKIDQYGIVINKDMFEEAGIPIPESWDFREFRETAKKLTKTEKGKKTYGMFFCTQQNLGYLLDFIAPCSMGTGFLIDGESGKSDFLRPEMMEMAETINSMMNMDHSAPTHIESVTQKLSQELMFLSGKTAMTLGPWIIRDLKNTKEYPHDFMTAFAPYPVADTAEDTYACGNLGDFLSINPDSKNKDEAWTFIMWYTTEGILPMVSKGGRIPAYKGFKTEEIMRYLMMDANGTLDEESARRVLVEPQEKYAISAVTPNVSEIYDIAKEELEQIFIGKKSVAEGLSDAKRRADKRLSDF